MKFNTLRKIKKTSLFIALMTILSGSILVPIIYHKQNKKQNKVKYKTKKIKEIKINNFKNEFLKTNKEIFKIMNDIATNKVKWNNFKKIIIENIAFQKESFPSSKVNLNKLNQNYIINNFEGIKNILYVVDKWETSDGKIKIFGHLKKDNLKVMIQPFLIDGFLTKKQNNIKKINLLNKSWIKSVFSVDHSIENYSIISKENVKNTILFNLQNQNILDVKIKIEYFNINKKKGKLSFSVDIYHLDKKHKKINVVYENLEKDISDQFKKINVQFLEKKVFKFLENDEYKDYQTINFQNFENIIKKLKLIKENNINVFINNKSFDPLKGHLNFNVYFFKKSYKTHVVKMFYNSNFLKNVSQDFIEDIKYRVKLIDGIHLHNIIDTWIHYSFYNIDTKEIKDYFKRYYPGWEVKIIPVKNCSFNNYEYRLELDHKEYKKVKIPIIHENDHFIEIEDSQREAFLKYYKAKKAFNVTNKLIREFLASKYNPLNN